MTLDPNILQNPNPSQPPTPADPNAKSAPAAPAAASQPTQNPSTASAKVVTPAQSPSGSTTPLNSGAAQTSAVSVATTHPTSMLRGILMGALGVAAKVGKGIEHEASIINQGGHVAAENNKIAQQGEIARQKQQAQAAEDAHIAAGDTHSEQPLRMSILTNSAVGGALLNATNLQNYNQTQRENFMKNNAEDAFIVQLFKDEGVPIIDDHGAGFDNLGPQQLKDLSPSGGFVALNNGKLGDDHGIYMADINLANRTPLSKDRTVVVGWDVDPKTGVMTERKQTLHAGQDTLGSVLTARYNAQNEFAEKSKIATQIENQNLNTANINQKNEAAKAAEASARAQELTAELERQQLNGGAGGGADNPALKDAIAALSPEGQQALAGMSPQKQAFFLRAARGYVDPKTFSASIRKGGLGMTREAADEILTAINPNYSDTLFSSMKKTINDFSGSGKQGQAIRSFNQFLVHAKELQDDSAALRRSNSPVLNIPLNEVRNKYFGQAGVPELMAAIEAARHEWQLFIDSGYVPDEQQEQRAQVLMNDAQTPAQILGVLGVMGRQAVGRLDQLNESYKTAVNGEDYPNLITPSGREAANALGLGDLIKNYKTGGHFGEPAPSSLQNIQINPRTGQTVGWDGNQWVDTKTGQPYIQGHK